MRGKVCVDRMPRVVRDARILLVDVALTAPKLVGKIEYEIYDPSVRCHSLLFIADNSQEEERFAQQEQQEEKLHVQYIFISVHRYRPHEFCLPEQLLFSALRKLALCASTLSLKLRY